MLVPPVLVNQRCLMNILSIYNYSLSPRPVVALGTGGRKGLGREYM